MLETELKTKSSPHKINFDPRNDKEEKHLEMMNNLLEEKRHGDWELIADILGIKAKNAEMAFKRVYSKHHVDVVSKLSLIIEQRKNLLNNL